MKAILQRVSQASVSVANQEIASIKKGWLLLLGVGLGDGKADVDIIADKTLGLRMFNDSDGKFNISALDAKAEILVVSQFTLFADLSKGRRPSFTASEHPEKARKLYEDLIDALTKSNLVIQSGQFGADMLVSLKNDGPVTIILDSKDYV